MQDQSITSYAITFGVIAIVLIFRWRRMSQMRPLKLERLWIFPTLYAAVAVFLFVQFPPTGWAWAFCALALTMGAALGWQRGRMMEITVDPETHALNQRASPAAVILIVVLIAVRAGARRVMEGDNALHMNAMAVTDMLIALALGLFTAQRIEMYLRAKRLLAEHRGAIR